MGSLVITHPTVAHPSFLSSAALLGGLLATSIIIQNNLFYLAFLPLLTPTRSFGGVLLAPERMDHRNLGRNLDTDNAGRPQKQNRILCQDTTVR